MKLTECFLERSKCYQGARKIAPQGLMIHSVGCPQPKAAPFIQQMDRPDATACVHAFIQPDGVVYQTLPWNYRGWHCGRGVKGSANGTHIGVEMTELVSIRYLGGARYRDKDPARTEVHVRAVYAVAVELFAKLCGKYGLDPLKDGVVISHKEGCARGVASNHGDPEHLWSAFGLTMDGFRAEIKAAMRGA